MTPGKYFLLLILTFVPLLTQAQEAFDFEAAWERLYRLELKGRPTSAAQVADSIFQAATAPEHALYRTKAIIYQAKFTLIKEENAPTIVIERLKAEIAKAKAPYRNFLEAYLAKSYLSIFENDKYKISERTGIVDPGEDFNTWDIAIFFRHIDEHFSNALVLNDSLARLPATTFEDLLTLEEEGRPFRPYLLDVLAYELLEFYVDEGHDTYYELPVDSYRIKDPAFLALPEEFAGLPLPDPGIYEYSIKTLRLLQRLSRFHLNDKQPDARVFFALERLEYLEQYGTYPQKELQLERAYKVLGEAYQGQEIAAYIDYCHAFYLKSLGDRFEAWEAYLNREFQFKRAEAKKVCEAAIEAFPESIGAERCRFLLNQLKMPELKLQAFAFNLPEQATKLRLTYRNYDSLYFATFHMGFAAYEKFEDNFSDSVRNATVARLTKVKDWSVVLPSEGDLQLHSTETLFPAHPTGQYLVVVARDPDFQNLLAHQWIQMTELALVDIGRANDNSYRVIHRETGAPQPGVEVKVSSVRYNGDIEFTRDFITNEQGDFELILSEGRYLRFNLKLENDSALYKNVYYSLNRSGNYSSQNVIRFQTFTDRSIYRPGQELFFKSILLKSSPANAYAIPDAELKVSLIDPNRQTIDTLRLTSNSFGSIHGSFKLPAQGLTGAYTLRVDPVDRNFPAFKGFRFGYQSANIQVEEYKRPRFEVLFEEVDTAYALGDSIKLSGRAIAFSGSNLTNVPVRYTIGRNIQSYGMHRYYRSDLERFESITLEVGETTIGADGTFEIVFKAEKDSDFDEILGALYNYWVRAEVTDQNGETRTGRQEFSLGDFRYLVDITSSKIIWSNQAADLKVNAESYNDYAQAIEGKLSVYKLQAPERVMRSEFWEMKDDPGFTKAEHERLFPHLPFDDNHLPENWPRVKLKWSANVTTSRTKAVDLGDLSGWQSGSYLVEFESIVNGDTISETGTFQLRHPGKTEVLDQEFFTITMDKPVYKVGETAICTISSAVPDLYAGLWLKNEKGLKKEFRERLQSEARTIAIPITEADTKGLVIDYYYAALNDFGQGKVRINVAVNRPALKLETRTFRSVFEPGSQETWSFRIRGEGRKRLSAELLASMYDVSLDQFYPHQWEFNTYNNSPYYSSNHINDLSGFSSTGFKITKRFASLPIPTIEFDQISLFGLDFDNPERAQVIYTEQLRWARNPLPRVLSEKRDLKPGIVQGVILDEVGNPIPNSVVTVKSKGASVIAEPDGTFNVETTVGDQLIFSFVGYESFAMEVGDDNYYTVHMMPDLAPEEKVVVVGYGTQEKKEIRTIEVYDTNIADALGIDRRSVSLGYSVAEGGPRYRYGRGDNSFAEYEIADDFEMLEEIPPTLQGAAPGPKAAFSAIKSRKDFRETAFFFPDLKTDRKGRVSFTFKAPEALTRWKLQMLAHTPSMVSVLDQRTVITQKELMLLPNPPRFVREGDELTFSAKVASLSDEVLQGAVKLELFNDVEGLSVQEILMSPAEQSFKVDPRGNTNLSWTFKVPEGLGLLRYRIVAAAGNFSDGEENVLPVLSNRMLVQETVPFWANANSSKTFTLQNLKQNKSASLSHHALTLTLTTNPVWEAIKNLPYLIEYPYECAEQTFARYYANRLGSHLVSQFPAIQSTFEQWKAGGGTVSKLEQNAALKSLLIEETPWLREAKNETERQQRLAMLFEATQLEDGLSTSLYKLRQLQLPSGGFPWFDGGERPNRYITQHIVSGFSHLRKLTGDDAFAKIQQKGMLYLDQQLIQDYKRIRETDSTYLTTKHLSFLQVQYLYVRAISDAPEASDDLSEALGYFTAQAKTYWQLMDLQSQAMIALYTQHSGDTQLARNIMSLLKEFATRSEERGIYWKKNNSGWRSWEAPIETQALLIEAFSEITTDTAFVDGMKQWILAEKRVKSWKSTKATTQAIYALLNAGSDWLQPNDQVQVTVGGQALELSVPSEAGAKAGTGDFTQRWEPEAIRPEMAELVVQNQGNTVAWGGLFWQYFEDLDQIQPENSGPLSLEKALYKVEQAGGREQLKPLGDEPLELGDLVRVRLVLRTDRSMEFIHIKDMRAAGFEPVNVLSGYKRQDGLGYYESTRDAATNFFISYLPQGTFVFEYDLRVNNKGDFSNGITTLQNMYAPEFSSHSKGVRVRVGR